MVFYIVYMLIDIIDDGLLIDWFIIDHCVYVAIIIQVSWWLSYIEPFRCISTGTIHVKYK
jgi:hypothetical protein